MRVTIVQYAGDYREAYERFEAGGKATYQAQRHSVGFVGDLAKRLDQVAVVCALTDGPYDVQLGNGVRAVGAGLRPGYADAALVPAVAATTPDRLVITTPSRALVGWAEQQRIRTITPLADSFSRASWKEKLRGWRLARRLNRPIVEWVGNHGLNACLSLMEIGVDPAKIIPWDWPAAVNPHDQPARHRVGGPFRLVYVGSVTESKGVGDLLDAIALLRDGNPRDGNPTVTAIIYGPDQDGAMARKAAALGLDGLATLAGPIANEDVIGAMASADAVIVPSRHDYPEGLPLTIYEALASRTPLIASDHPMFRGALTDGESAAIFRASDPADLARAILLLAGDADLYARLSANGAAAWDALQLPVEWSRLIERWIDGDRDWLAGHAVASGRYEARLAQRRAALKAVAR